MNCGPAASAFAQSICSEHSADGFDFAALGPERLLRAFALSVLLMDFLILLCIVRDYPLSPSLCWARAGRHQPSSWSTNDLLHSSMSVAQQPTIVGSRFIVGRLDDHPLGHAGPPQEVFKNDGKSITNLWLSKSKNRWWSGP